MSGINYNITKEDIKSILSYIKDHRLIIFLFGFVVGLASFYLFNNILINLKEQNLASVANSLNVKIDNSKNNLSISKDIECKDGIFKDDLGNWIIPSSYDRVDEEGFYCPRKSSSFLSPDIWYKNLIPTNFESLEIRYKLKNKNNSTTTTPSFIFSIGEKPRILRLYIPEKNNYIVGCERIIATTSGSGFSLVREDIHSLNEPIGWQEDAEAKVRVTINKGNEARFDVNLSYLSALDGKPTEEYFSYNVALSDPKPLSELSKIVIGFATLKGNCVKPISYKFCY